MAALFMLLQATGLLNRLAPGQLAQSGMGYGMLFLVGLMTSLHCVAMCGGISLSQSLPGGQAQAKSSTRGADPGTAVQRGAGDLLYPHGADLRHAGHAVWRGAGYLAIRAGAGGAQGRGGAMHAGDGAKPAGAVSRPAQAADAPAPPAKAAAPARPADGGAAQRPDALRPAASHAVSRAIQRKPGARGAVHAGLQPGHGAADAGGWGRWYRCWGSASGVPSRWAARCWWP